MPFLIFFILVAGNESHGNVFQLNLHELIHIINLIVIYRITDSFLRLSLKPV